MSTTKAARPTAPPCRLKTAKPDVVALHYRGELEQHAPYAIIGALQTI